MAKQERPSLLVLLAALTLAGSLQAQDPPAPPASTESPAASPASPASGAPAAPETVEPDLQPDCLRLDDAGLDGMLKLAGYDPKTSAEGWHEIVWDDTKGWKPTFGLSMPDNKKYVWVTLRVVNAIPDPNKVPSRIYLELLRHNNELGPTHFSYDAAHKSILLNHFFVNCNLTKEAVAKEIETFGKRARSCYFAWKGDQYKNPPAQ